MCYKYLLVDFISSYVCGEYDDSNEVYGYSLDLEFKINFTNC